MRPYRITIHCTDTDNGQDISSESINRFHIEERGWDRIGYHVVIHPDGELDSRHNKTFFRGLNEQGAHVEGENEGNIGVAFIGRDKFTLEQFWAFERLYEGLRQVYNIEVSSIYCHHEFNHDKTCPNMRSSNLVAFLLTGKVKHIIKYIEGK